MAADDEDLRGTGPVHFPPRQSDPVRVARYTDVAFADTLRRLLSGGSAPSDQQAAVLDLVRLQETANEATPDRD